MLSINYVWSFTTNRRTANQDRLYCTLQADIVVTVDLSKLLIIKGLILSQDAAIVKYVCCVLLDCHCHS